MHVDGSICENWSGGSFFTEEYFLHDRTIKLANCNASSFFFLVKQSFLHIHLTILLLDHSGCYLTLLE